MSKRTAHFILFFGDILAIFTFWLGYNEIHQVFIGVTSSSDSVSFMNRTGAHFIMISLPIFHLFALVDYFKPSLVEKWRDPFHRAILFLTLGLFVLAFFISTGTKQYVENSGFQYCQDATSSGVLFRKLVYTKDRETCDKLGAERREKLGLPPRK